MSFWYIASPYSHPDPTIEVQRYRETAEVTAILLKERFPVYSPIVHCHELAQRHNMPKDFQFWQWYNESMMEGAAGCFVLMMPGWVESKGVQAEMEWFKCKGKQVWALNPYAVKDTDIRPLHLTLINKLTGGLRHD